MKHQLIVNSFAIIFIMKKEYYLPAVVSSVLILNSFSWAVLQGHLVTLLNVCENKQ